ncbi:MAG: hypothetical protein IGS23_22165 [Rivularia sp. T60_A2020_040]|nr:hypothetical protein [Rivularia sp. T60_A2020_040]
MHQYSDLRSFTTKIFAPQSSQKLNAFTVYKLLDISSQYYYQTTAN